MQSVTAEPFSKRPVPTPKDANLAEWADKIAAWLGIEFGNVQRAQARASACTVTSATTATTDDGLILANATGGAFTVTLPNPTTARNTSITIKRLNAGGNAVTVGGTVDGTLNRTLTSQYATMTVWSDGSAWYRTSVI